MTSKKLHAVCHAMFVCKGASRRADRAWRPARQDSGAAASGAVACERARAGADGQDTQVRPPSASSMHYPLCAIQSQFSQSFLMQP